MESLLCRQKLPSCRHLCNLISRSQRTISSCRHTSWLDFTHTPDVLWDTGCLSRFLLELTNPTRQKPSLILFVGRKSKELALRVLFPWNNIKRSSHEGLVTLRADTLSLQSDFPIFFAESDPLNTLLHSEALAGIVESKRWS